ncbi:DUF2306 domain-containing protein [Amylibacter sp. IMCC11727]|uniref:DUF2306 domain-containing protein n=1 Tax=Amylibacter sp. IMCC11727 TaxID=3039851 RepID=UPI00244D9A2C|nr:DUF2306 domain-containing protein [Amylibacter sp. IMCC11727]WGI20534.1 DUF2306 domain-containing protein [Amylibacter sp. IMCC11727]
MSFTAFAEASLVIQIHVLTALAAAILGPIALLRKRKDRIHKVTGYVWVTVMAITALTSFFIWTIRVVGVFSPIHILSVITIIGLVQAIYRIKQRDIFGHRRVLWRLYYQAIGLAGLFSFLPQRMMNDMFTFASPWVVFGVAFGVFIFLGAVISTLFDRVQPKDLIS